MVRCCSEFIGCIFSQFIQKVNCLAWIYTDLQCRLDSLALLLSLISQLQEAGNRGNHQRQHGQYSCGVWS